MKVQIEAQKKYHCSLLEDAEIVKIKKHDLRHQLAVIRKLSVSKSNNKLTSYIDNLIHEIPSDNTSIYCKNMAVNAVVAHYASLAKDQGIDISIKLNIPEHMKKISDSNLSVVFGNLFENAIEACVRMTEGHKFINLNSRLQYDTLTITMDNSFDGRFDREKDKFISSKNKEVGTGLASISAVAESHDGNANFEADGLVFLSSIYVRV